MGRIDARLNALEQREQAVRGFRIFQQDWEDEHVFHEGMSQESTPYTKAEIDTLGAAGWQCVVVVYEDKEIDQEAAQWLGDITNQ
jgi:hypothetical protein